MTSSACQGIYASFWHGMWVPKGTPQAIVDKLNAAVIETLADPAVKQRLKDIGQEHFPARATDAGGARRQAEEPKSRYGGRSSRPTASRRNNAATDRRSTMKTVSRWPRPSLALAARRAGAIGLSEQAGEDHHRFRAGQRHRRRRAADGRTAQHGLGPAGRGRKPARRRRLDRGARGFDRPTPDGYTLYVGAASTFTALKGAPGVAPNLPIELPRDFAPIGFITQQPMFIAVSPTIGVKSLPELIALAKKKPGELSYATTGRGRITHLTMELLQERAGIKLQMIPYTGGPTAAMADVGTGRVAIVIEGYSGLAGGINSHLINGIAVSSYERLPEFKDLPTVAEVLPGFIAGGWNVLLAPIGTPEAIIRKASADLRKALDDAETQEQARRAWRLSASDDARAGHRLCPGTAEDLAADRRRRSPPRCSRSSFAPTVSGACALRKILVGAGLRWRLRG